MSRKPRTGRVVLGVGLVVLAIATYVTGVVLCAVLIGEGTFPFRLGGPFVIVGVLLVGANASLLGRGSPTRDMAWRRRWQLIHRGAQTLNIATVILIAVWALVSTP